ncbi:STAS domain-containing protein [Stutzerimonas azotifigens]|uniref:STAS domain-containing protein n=1 Tax=Stutzerimonas azotifigens TaxID=291995 RepID=A0ABR5Z5A0_9GAMM|nr:STAS domain-containing protein [Stutzerimonas azotifigens]MBA1275329.1 STAS domain-containing protein [Stutzerimonas azotifigens]
MSEVDMQPIAPLEGPLTIYTAADSKAALLQLIQPELAVEIDLRLVDEIDCAGLQLLILAKREARRLNGQIVLTNPSPAVAAALELSGLASELGCSSREPNIGEAS